MTFEDALPTIIEQIEKRRSRWNVHISYIDFDDIKQLLIIHIFEKWYQFNETKGELSHWVSKICSSQIKNHWRNLLGNTIPPCDYCPANEGGDKCRIFTTKDPTKCSILSKWARTKVQKYNLKLAANIDDHAHSIFYENNEVTNYFDSLEKITEIIKSQLTRKQFKVYKLLYIDNKSEEETAKIMGYKGSVGRKTGYASLRANKLIIIDKIKQILKNYDIL